MKSFNATGVLAVTGILALAPAVAQIRPEPADALPKCSIRQVSPTDCHIHDRQTYLEMFVNKPSPSTQPHAWQEYREQDRIEQRQQNG